MCREPSPTDSLFASVAVDDAERSFAARDIRQRNAHVFGARDLRRHLIPHAERLSVRPCHRCQRGPISDRPWRDGPRRSLGKCKSLSILSVLVLSFGAISTSVLASRVLREPASISFRSASQSIHLRSAEMNRSAGAPDSICLAIADDAANERVTFFDVLAS